MGQFIAESSPGPFCDTDLSRYILKVAVLGRLGGSVILVSNS